MLQGSTGGYHDATLASRALHEIPLVLSSELMQASTYSCGKKVSIRWKAPITLACILTFLLWRYTSKILHTPNMIDGVL